MLVSRNSMKAASETTAAISQGLNLGRQRVVSAGGGAPVPGEVSLGSAIESEFFSRPDLGGDSQQPAAWWMILPFGELSCPPSVRLRIELTGPGREDGRSLGAPGGEFCLFCDLFPVPHAVSCSHQ